MSACRKRIKWIAVLLCMVMGAALLAPLGFRASAEIRRPVRVGWYESSFNRMDASGRRTGYAYEYQQRIAAYTGWTFEYVDGTWTELLTKLEKGEIDLLSDVSYTEERARKMLFSDEPMGTETYYLFITPENRSITADDLTSVNGKKVGVMEGSVQADFLRQWAKEQGLTPKIMELRGSTDETMEMLFCGDLDALVTMDGLGTTRPCVPVCKIGGSDFYFAVKRNRPDLLMELNNAMSRILEEDRDYDQRLFDKYVRSYGSSAFLNAAEQKWCQFHLPIRVAYCADYQPFCDEQDGALTGALTEYLDLMRDSIKTVSVSFETVAYPTTEAALDAMLNGEVDCVFPVNLSPYDGETFQVLTTSPLVQSEIYAVMKRTEQGRLSEDQELTVGLLSSNLNYLVFLKDFFPQWKSVEYEDAEGCIEAVQDGVVDCVLVNSYRMSYTQQLLKRYDFQTLPTGKAMGFSFAVRRTDTELYSILNKAVSLIPRATMEAVLLAQPLPEERVTLRAFLRDNWLRVVIVLLIACGVVYMLLAQRAKEKRIAEERQRLIDATERDSLTGLYNRDFFYAYAGQYYREHPGEPMEAIMLNIDSFHSVNALYGWEFGNTVLRLLSGGIKEYLGDGPGIAGRIEADCFVVYCPFTTDYETTLAKFQAELDRFNSSVRVRMGVMPKTKGVDPMQMFERARTACGLARKEFKSHLVVFNEKMRQREIFERRLLTDLDRAVKEKQLHVYYQPKYDIQCDPPKLVSAEALIRWQHPEYGLLKPNEFIPLLERSSRIGVVDRYVWNEAARQISVWQKTYGVLIPVSVNLSRMDIFDPNLIGIFEQLMRSNGLEHSAVKLEVTETAYTENASQVIQVVNTLRQKGFEIEMDDFGTGYSSLNMLSNLPVDVLKMDQDFVRNIGRDEKDDRLVALILDIARNLNVPVVAEGVETKEQLNVLRELGCSYVQGYFFARALQVEDFEKLAFGVKK